MYHIKYKISIKSRNNFLKSNGSYIIDKENSSPEKFPPEA